MQTFNDKTHQVIAQDIIMYKNYEEDIMKKSTNCEQCLFYVYDDEDGIYSCQVSLDEDETERYMRSSNFACPYYRLNDEYATVKKQI